MRDVKIVPPSELTGITLGQPKDRAAGVSAVTVALKHIAEEAGLWKGLKALSKMNQRDGFDCPGCAWPEPAHRSKLGEYCENGAKAIAEEATEARCDLDFFMKNSVEEISRLSDYQIGKSGRIVHPMYLPKDKSHYEPVSWKRAFEIIRDELSLCVNPDEAVFYTSGRTSNEAAYLYQLFVRLFGTNNLPDCSNMCHESSGVALGETIGLGKGSVTLEDIYDAELILVVGQNPGTNHPRMLSALQRCKQNGGIIVHINPLPEAGTSRFVDPQSPVEILKGGTRIADFFLQVRIGEDLALFKAINARLMQMQSEGKNVLDMEFIADSTSGFESFRDAISNVNIDEMIFRSGVDREVLNRVIDLIASKGKIITCWAMGLTQHKYAVATIQEVCNLHFMRGAIGKRGAGLCPVRGHSNVQGDRTMGIYEKPADTWLQRFDAFYGTNLPRKHGYDVVEAIEAMDRGEVRFFMAMGGNFISATPDSEFTGRAMQKVDLTVLVSTKLCRSHAITGKHALILPCLGRTEMDVQSSGIQFVTVENSMGVVSSSKGNIKPCDHHLMSEPAIVAEMAKAVFRDKFDIPWDDFIGNYDVIRDHIEATIPGFDDYNKRVRQPDGFYLPNGPREGKFLTPDQKARFSISDIEPIARKADSLVMMTMRSHDQYNTTIYGLNDRYRGIANERRVVFMHRNDMLQRSLNNLDLVDIQSDSDGTRRIAERFHAIEFNIPQGNCATYFPETNCLVPIGSTALKSNTPMSKWIEVQIFKTKT
jgi:molybdopterin-dependent oxidoreductase alpha subunit